MFTVSWANISTPFNASCMQCLCRRLVMYERFSLTNRYAGLTPCFLLKSSWQEPINCMGGRWPLIPCCLVRGVRALDTSHNATKSGRPGDNDGGLARGCRLASQKLWCSARGECVQGALCMHVGICVYMCVCSPAHLYVCRRVCRGFGFSDE